MFRSLITTLFLATLPLMVQAEECTFPENTMSGSATFTGGPWTHEWFVTAQWDNKKGAWIDIDPIRHTLDVPGAALEIHFTDGSAFNYTGGVGGTQADNLSTLKKAMSNETDLYTAIKTADNEVFLITDDCRRSWDLAWQQ